MKAARWIGGRVPVPMIVEELGATRTIVTVWLEEPDGQVVYLTLEDPREAEIPFGDTLLQAMAAPEMGEARRPRRVRVAYPAQAAEVKRVCPDIRVEIAPTPEIRALARELAEHESGPGGLLRASYLEDGRASPETVAALFGAAGELFSVAPWQVITGDDPLRLDAPDLGLEGAWVSVIGDAGENDGFLLFDSKEHFEIFLDSAGDVSDALDLGGSMLSLSFETRADIAPRRRLEIEEHGWPVTGESAVPVVERRGADGTVMPIGDPDYRVATKVASALASFFRRRPADWNAEQGPGASETFTDGDGVEIRVTALDLAWSEPIPEGASDGPLAVGDELRARLSALQQSLREATLQLLESIEKEEDLQLEMGPAMRLFFGGRNVFTGATEEQTDLALGRFIEWFAFERRSDAHDCPPVQTFLERLPEADARARVARLAESVVDSFAVREVDLGTGLVVESFASGRRYEVFDRVASTQLVSGSVALGRLFPLDERFWAFSPQMAFLDDPRAASAVEREFAGLEPVKRSPPSQCDIEDLLAAGEPGSPGVVDTGPAVLEEVKDAIRRNLEDAGIGLDFDDLRRQMSRASSPTTLMKSLLDRGSFDGQEHIEATMDSLMRLWNATPHSVPAGGAKRGAGARAGEPAPSRNAPCPCGSGKWYKRCCGR